MLVGTVEVAEHALLAQVCGREYCNLRTRGDGACGLHAAFGRPNNGEFACGPNVRRVAATLMETYAAEVLGGLRVGSRWFRDVEESLGEELCAPCAKAELGFGDAEPDDEAWCFWGELAEPDRESACSHILRRLESEEAARLRRLRFAEVARRCCVPALEARVMRQFGVLNGVLPSMDIAYLDISEEQRVDVVSMAKPIRVLARRFRGAGRWIEACEGIRR